MIVLKIKITDFLLIRNQIRLKRMILKNIINKLTSIKTSNNSQLTIFLLTIKKTPRKSKLIRMIILNSLLLSASNLIRAKIQNSSQPVKIFQAL